MKAYCEIDRLRKSSAAVVVWVMVGVWLGMMVVPPVGTAVLSAQPVVGDSIPDPMPLVDIPQGTKLFLLFGTATDNPANPGLADMVMLVAVNSAANSVAMLALPRDLWVYVPELGMKKLNTAYYYGEINGIEGGGVGLMKRTIAYNFGIEVDYYAHVNFTGFLEMIDTLGGIEIAVDCTIRDWKLKSRHLNKLQAENYEIFTLTTGLHTLDADTALWYVRSRITSSDLDRNRRQQDVLRAVWRKIRQRDLLTYLPTLWDSVIQWVDTDFTLNDALAYAPMATALDAGTITDYRLEIGKHIQAMLSPSPEKAFIFVPDRPALGELLHDFVQPPTANQIARRELRVEIVNASGVDFLEWVAADRLAHEGFTSVIVAAPTRYRNFNTIYDYTGQTKGSPLPEMMRVLRVTDAGIVSQPDPNRTTDYRVYIGRQYLYWACTHDVIQPRLTLDEFGNVIVDETWPESTPTPTPAP